MAKSCLPQCRASAATLGLSLSRRSLVLYPRVAALSLLEVLIVMLVIGILCGTGLSLFSGVTRDSQLRTRTDELNSFFAACRQRVKLRRMPLRFIYDNGILGIDQSQSLSYRLPELPAEQGERLFNRLGIASDGTFLLNHQKIERLTLPVILPGGRHETITLEL